jgi:hypothetical protein
VASKQADVCSCCSNERTNKGQDLRPLYAIYLKDSDKPFLLCTYCDGDAVLSAKALESKGTE